MAHEAQHGLLARALTEQPGLGIGGRSMGVVAPLLAGGTKGVASRPLGGQPRSDEPAVTVIRPGGARSRLL
jgi:hypothetical protein